MSHKLMFFQTAYLMVVSHTSSPHKQKVRTNGPDKGSLQLHTSSHRAHSQQNVIITSSDKHGSRGFLTTSPDKQKGPYNLVVQIKDPDRNDNIEMEESFYFNDEQSGSDESRAGRNHHSR